MNVTRTLTCKQIFGDKRFLMIFPMESMMGIKSESLESMEQEKVLC